MSKPPGLAIVVPCFNEEEILPWTIGQILNKLQEMATDGKVAPSSFACFVDDGSRDRTWEIIREEHRRDPRVRGLKLTANRGHQHALLAGMEVVEDQADIVITIDADLQDDIHVMDQFVDQYRKGYDVVYGVRRKRDTDTAAKKWTALFFYKLVSWLGVCIVHNHADYRLVSRRVLAGLREYREVNLFLRGIFPSMGFRSNTVLYDRQDRRAGTTKYPLKKMLAFAIEGITSFSVVPLRIVSLIGILSFLLSVGLTGWALWQRYMGYVVPGWSSLIISIYFLGAVQLLSIGLIGEYIGKLYSEVKSRPRYLIEERLL